jgi:DNA-binding LytR/AlgR family response regulator
MRSATESNDRPITDRMMLAQEQPYSTTPMPVRILVVEDEAIVRADLKHTLLGMDHFVVGDTGKGREAVAMAMELEPDLILLDVGLAGGMSGLEVAREVRRLRNIPVIFLTGHSEGAMMMEARKAEPYGYLLKPFKVVEVRTAIELALHKHRADSNLVSERDALYRTLNRTPAPDRIFVRCQGRYVRVRLDSIYYVEAMRDSIAIHLRDRRLICHETLKHFESCLPPEDFVRVHRSFIVRVDKIAAIQDSDVLMEDAKPLIPIGVTHHSPLMARLQ